VCIVAVAHLCSSRFPLIVAANRDEQHARPTAPAAWWNDDPAILAGRDLIAGGTWLGVTRTGRFAAVTNIFAPGTPPAGRSRGELVTSFLASRSSPADFAREITTDGESYGPFKVLVRNERSLWFASNRESMRSLDAGVHVYSNNAPPSRWSKVDDLTRTMLDAAVFDDPTPFLLDALSGSGARGPLERAAESPFVVGERFGTRCTTVLTIDAAGQAHFVEQSFDARGLSTNRAEFAFALTD